jgi:hypothetical protein
VLNAGTNSSGGSTCTAADPCTNANITEFAVGGNGILTYQQTFYTQGFNPSRLLADTSGTHLFVLMTMRPAPPTPPRPPAPRIPTPTALRRHRRHHLRRHYGLLGQRHHWPPDTGHQCPADLFEGTQVSYFPVPANPVDVAFTTSYVMTVSGAAGTQQVVYPYAYNSSTGQLDPEPEHAAESQWPAERKRTTAANVTAIVYAGGKVYILDNDPYTSSQAGGQVLTFTIGTNGALAALSTGGVVADDPTETDPVWLILETKGTFVYLANQQGASLQRRRGHHHLFG